MKLLLQTLTAAMILATAMPCAAVDLSFSTGMQYESWTSDHDDSGNQFYLPLKVAAQASSYSLSLVGGYAATEGDLAGEQKASLSSVLDTQVKFSYELDNWISADWLMGVDVNLPTGQTRLDETKLKILADPDLVSVTRLGRGLNLTPFISAAREFGPWTAGLGISYAWQGKYDYSEQTRDYDPGDILKLVSMIDYAFNDRWQAGLVIEYTHYGTDTQQDQDFIEKSDAWRVGAHADYARDDWDISLAVQGIFRGKSKFRQNLSTFAIEPYDGQGDEWHIDAQWQYQWGKLTTLRSRLSYLNVAANDYDPSSYFYAGEIQKTSLSLGADYLLTKTLTLESMLKYFFMDQDPNWLHPNENRSYRSWSVLLGLSNHF